MSKKQKFYIHPNKDPRNDKIIVIGDPVYKELVYLYGEPSKIVSPKTKSKIGVNKGEYKKLIKEGYTDDQLLYGDKSNNLPSDVMYEIMLRADFQTTQELCQSNQSMFKLCQEVSFWKNKIHYFFPYLKIPPQVMESDEYNVVGEVDILQDLFVKMSNAIKKAKEILLINQLKQLEINNDHENYIKIDFFQDIDLYYLPPSIVENKPNTPKELILNLVNNQYELYIKRYINKKLNELEIVITPEEALVILSLILFDGLSYKLKITDYFNINLLDSYNSTLKNHTINAARRDRFNMMIMLAYLEKNNQLKL